MQNDGVSRVLVPFHIAKFSEISVRLLDANDAKNGSHVIQQPVYGRNAVKGCDKCHTLYEDGGHFKFIAEKR